MPYIYPRTWEHGVMPLDEFPEEHQRRIVELAGSPTPPPRFIHFPGVRIESRAWWEWHWTRGRRLKYIPPKNRRPKLSKIKRQLVIERDGLVCGICKGEVEPHLLEIDHIHPVSLGGTNDLDNLQVAHALCNRKKGARVNA